jgi:hypothetical protein
MTKNNNKDQEPSGEELNGSRAAELEEQLVEKNSRISGLEQALAERDEQINSLKQSLAELEAAVVELKAKALRDKFEETFIYGDSSDNKQFDGLRKLIDTTTSGDQVISMGGTGATLTLAKLDELIDAVKGGKPDLLLMSRRSRRKINALVRAAGGMIETDRDKWGNFVQLWDGIPVGVNDWIMDTHVLSGGVETNTTGGSCSTIYAFPRGEGALCGLTGPGHLTVEPIGSLETKDASRTRIKWYCSLALFSSIKAAALIGVKD